VTRALASVLLLGLLPMLLFASISARADVVMGWAAASGTILVAHDGKIEAFDRSGGRMLWSAKGLATPSAMVVSADGKGAAILDAFADRVALFSVAGGPVRFHDTPNTPVAAAFFGHDLWVVLRDRSRVRRITEEGAETDVAVALDPALIAVSDKFVYVYSRADGLLQEIDPQSAQVTRSVQTGIAGSDLEIRVTGREAPRGEPSGGSAYLCLPNGKIEVIRLALMESGQIRLGASPIDLALVPPNDSLPWTEGTALIADPGKPALHTATDLRRTTPIRTPTPVDRITITSTGAFAFDSNSGTLYRVHEKTLTAVASGLTATSFVVTKNGVFRWDGDGGRVTLVDG